MVDWRELTEDPAFVLVTDARDDGKENLAVVLTEAVEDNGPDPIADDGFTVLDKPDRTEDT